MTPKIKRIRRFYYKHPLLISSLIGGLIGFFVIAPAELVAEHIAGVETIKEHINELSILGVFFFFTIFTLLGAGTGLIVGYMQKRIYELESGLFQTDKLASVGLLAAGVAHEINTPLTNISLLADNLKIKNKDDGQTENLNEISNQVDKASKIVIDLLDFSKSPELELVDVNVNDILSHSLSFIKSKRGENVKTIENYDKDLPWIIAEPNQLQQVFMNIIINAYDAMSKGGRLEIITCASKDEYIKIKFKDNGMGIPKGNLSKIFDPFFTTKEPGKGTGLGLSICHGIIRNHGGRIEVNSNIKVGTTFTLFLPR